MKHLRSWRAQPRTVRFDSSRQLQLPWLALFLTLLHRIEMSIVQHFSFPGLLQAECRSALQRASGETGFIGVLSSSSACITRLACPGFSQLQLSTCRGFPGPFLRLQPIVLRNQPGHPVQGDIGTGSPWSPATPNARFYGEKPGVA
ncbi:hypothetical protein BDV19DRAFT_695 [Aspergillus venezuelensis]